MIVTTLKGTELHEDDRRYVLAAYIYRRRSRLYKNDQQWLENTRFTVRKDHRLDRRVKHCHSF